jgi:hypothetical protein
MAKPQRKGVLALVEGLYDQYNYGDLDEGLKAEIKDDVLKAVHLKDQLEAALADWDPRAADHTRTSSRTRSASSTPSCPSREKMNRTRRR